MQFSIMPSSESKSRFLPATSALRVVKVQLSINSPEVEVKVVDTSDDEVIKKVKVRD